MSRRRLAWMLGLAILAPSSAAAEHWCFGPWRQFRHNNDWPEQFLDHDRAATRAPFCVMVANGWRSQNTLSSYHFDEDTGKLNETGRLKLRAILFETPTEWRSIYILRSDEQAVTSSRVAAAQAAAKTMLQGEPMPPLLVTTVEPFGTRGEVITRINTAATENAVAPVLPPATRFDVTGGN